MQRTFEFTRTSRTIISKFLDNYTLEQLNTIPNGFNNNLIWNIGHIIVVQQMLVYNLSGLPMMVSTEMVGKYKKGTRPEADVTKEEVDEIRKLLIATIDRSEADFNDQIFKNYNPFTTATGFTLTTAEDAMAFNYYHEATHLGMMMSIRKFI